MELQTYQAKFSVQLDLLAEENPYLSPKDALVKMLETSLTTFVLENWKEQPRKMAV